MHRGRTYSKVNISEGTYGVVSIILNMSFDIFLIGCDNLSGTCQQLMQISQVMKLLCKERMGKWYEEGNKATVKRFLHPTVLF